MLRSALSVFVTPTRATSTSMSADDDQLDRVVGGEERRGVEQDHVEAPAGGGDDLALRRDHLRRVRRRIGEDVGDDLHAGDAGLVHPPRLVLDAEVAVDGRAAEVAVDHQHRRAGLGEHRGEVRGGRRLAFARRRRGDHDDERLVVLGLEERVAERGAVARSFSAVRLLARPPSRRG